MEDCLPFYSKYLLYNLHHFLTTRYSFMCFFFTLLPSFTFHLQQCANRKLKLTPPPNPTREDNQVLDSPWCVTALVTLILIYFLFFPHCHSSFFLLVRTKNPYDHPYGVGVSTKQHPNFSLVFHSWPNTEVEKKHQRDSTLTITPTANFFYNLMVKLGFHTFLTLKRQG